MTFNWMQSKVMRTGLLLATLAGIYEVQPYRPVVVTGVSMEPTFQNHALLLAKRPDRTIQRGDVVVLNTSQGTLIKRVAYLPGDEIAQFHCRDGWTDVIYACLPKTQDAIHRLTRTVQVPSGMVYVLGDNSSYSVDSRQLGFIPIKDVIAIVPNTKPGPAINRVANPINMTASRAETRPSG